MSEHGGASAVVSLHARVLVKTPRPSATVSRASATRRRLAKSTTGSRDWAVLSRFIESHFLGQQPQLAHPYHSPSESLGSCPSMSNALVVVFSLSHTSVDRDDHLSPTCSKIPARQNARPTKLIMLKRSPLKRCASAKVIISCKRHICNHSSKQRKTKRKVRTFRIPNTLSVNPEVLTSNKYSKRIDE
jgi:hypothetical protein